MTLGRGSLAGCVALLLAACAPAGHGHHVHDGTSAASEGGLLKLSWSAAAALARDGNVFTVTVLDARSGDVPLTGAGVTLELKSTGSEALVQSATETTGGAYESPAIDFPAGGEWTMTVHVSKGDHAELHDHATFRLQIP